MTKYWAFARGGAWRNPKPKGGPYVCEQCRLDAGGGNDATLTMQAVTTIERAPADVVRRLAGRDCWRNWRSKIEHDGTPRYWMAPYSRMEGAVYLATPASPAAPTYYSWLPITMITWKCMFSTWRERVETLSLS